MKTLVYMTIAAALAISGCKIGAKYTVGGTLTGLTGHGLVLEDNSGNDLSLDSNGGFAFTDGIRNGDAYSVTVKTQPSDPAQTCTVHNGSGTIDKADVTNVIVSCTQAGRFAYVANQLSNNLSAYAIDANGALSPIAGSPFAAAGTAPASLTVDPNGRYLYVVYSGSNDVSVYAIDNSTGALASAGIPQAAGSGPSAVTVDPRDAYLYVTNLASNNVSAYAIDGFHRTAHRACRFSLRRGRATHVIEDRCERQLSLRHQLQRQRGGIRHRFRHRLLERHCGVAVRRRCRRTVHCH